MFFSGIPNIFVPGDSVFMLFKCMCDDISIEKNIYLESSFNIFQNSVQLVCVEFKI